MRSEWRGDELLARMAGARTQALRDGCELALELSNAISPTELGAMDDTGRVVVDGDEGAVVYDSEYALKQHEMTYYRHRNGDQPKFLERTVVNKRDQILERMAATMRSALGGVTT